MSKRPRSDHRLSWRDPLMPVLRSYRMADGTLRTLIDPEYERGYREFLMETTSHPSYKTDPTYDLKKQRKRI